MESLVWGLLLLISFPRQCNLFIFSVATYWWHPILNPGHWICPHFDSFVFRYSWVSCQEKDLPVWGKKYVKVKKFIRVWGVWRLDVINVEETSTIETEFTIDATVLNEAFFFFFYVYGMLSLGMSWFFYFIL